jgi:PhnB protein
MQVNPIPEGYHTVTPYLAVQNAAKAIDFYKKAFDATEISRLDGPQGKVAHAELKIGDSRIMVSDEMPGADARAPQAVGGTTTNMVLYVKDSDASFNKAVQAGAKPAQPMSDMFWGDRIGRVLDPFGHSWSIATHKEDVAPAEMKKRFDAFVAKQGSQQRTSTA